MNTWHFWEPFTQDIRYAFRSMAGSKLFTSMAILSLALGIGANTAIYSFMDGVMLRALPVHRSEQLVILNWRAKSDAPVVHTHWGDNYDEPGGGKTSPNFPYPAFELLRDHNDVFSSLFGHVRGGRLNLVIDGNAELASGQYVTGGFFSGLGVPPAAGRLIDPDDDRLGAPSVAIITNDYWHTRFGASPSVIGKHIQINGTSFTIAGVSAPDFYGVSPDSKPSVFLPMANIGLTHPTDGSMFSDGTYYWIELMGRLKSGVTLQQAQAQLAGPFHGFVESTATKDRERADLPSLWLQEGGSGVDSLRRQYSKPLWILMAMVGLILAVACFNIANLLLARTATRRREIALRLSLGAGRFRIVRQLMTESVVLAILGGIAGVGVAALCIRFLLLLLTNGNGNFSVNVRLDWRVLSFTLLIAIISGIFFGLAPALQSIRVDITPALKETRASEAHGKARRFGLRFGLSQALVVGQIGISLLLVAAAGLFVRTIANLHSVNLGFNAENILIFTLDATQAGYKDASLKQFYKELEQRFQAIPGVRNATSSDMPLVGGWSSSTSITVPGIPKPPEGQRGPNTSYALVGSTFFETMEIPIVAGRAIDKRDVEGAPLAAVVNQIFAEKYFHGQNPVGRHFTLGGTTNAADVEIVGIARTARYSSLKREIPPVTYLPWIQAPKSRQLREMIFELRASGDPLALTKTVRQIVHEVGPQVPVADITTQSRRIDQTISQERTFAQLCACFGALALLMACVGLYGTMAYAVARRTGEIGIRMALGATRGRVVRMILREVAVLSAFGLLAGLVAAYQTTVFLKSFLFGVKPNDPFAIGGSVAILIACALLAGYLPALRASRIDPMAALRNE
ncbi:MAG TPA: ABC transporter permease [Bryobacteraceae bacterium]|jgi:macrolide transport system ATP-binding/permease protein|nr:ABC transporter permease [Bryobacteraceae bacterium]